MADYPVVPLDKVSAQLNIDMVGRNRCDDPKESNTVYVVGSDRISTELHNLNEESNAGLEKPMKLDYEMNDPADPESIYTRSDHYSYASKGIPIIFYTTGLHRDYHYVTDEVEQDRVPEAGAHRAARLHDRAEGREHGSRPRARQQGAAQGEGGRGEDRRLGQKAEGHPKSDGECQVTKADGQGPASEEDQARTGGSGNPKR